MCVRERERERERVCVCAYVRVYEDEYCFCDMGDIQSKYGDFLKKKEGKKQELDCQQTG